MSGRRFRVCPAGDAFAQAEDLGHVHRLALVGLLAGGVAHTRVGFHDDPRLRAVLAGLERARGPHDLAVLGVLRLLPEVPDVALPVLGEPVQGLLDQLPVDGDPVPEDDAGYAVSLWCHG